MKQHLQRRHTVGRRVEEPEKSTQRIMSMAMLQQPRVHAEPLFVGGIPPVDDTSENWYTSGWLKGMTSNVDLSFLSTNRRVERDNKEETKTFSNNVQAGEAGKTLVKDIDPTPRVVRRRLKTATDAAAAAAVVTPSTLAPVVKTRSSNTRVTPSVSSSSLVNDIASCSLEESTPSLPPSTKRMLAEAPPPPNREVKMRRREV